MEEEEVEKEGEKANSKSSSDNTDNVDTGRHIDKYTDNGHCSRVSALAGYDVIDLPIYSPPLTSSRLTPNSPNSPPKTLLSPGDKGFLPLAGPDTGDIRDRGVGVENVRPHELYLHSSSLSSLCERESVKYHTDYRLGKQRVLFISSWVGNGGTGNGGNRGNDHIKTRL